MAKRITDEDLRLNLIVNGDGGRKEMLALDRQMKDLQSSTKRTRTELKNLEKAGKTGSQEHQNLTKTLKDQEKTLTECREKYNKLRDAISLENKTLAELRNHLKLTQTALSKAVPGTENWCGGPEDQGEAERAELAGWADQERAGEVVERQGRRFGGVRRDCRSDQRRGKGVPEDNGLRAGQREPLHHHRQERQRHRSPDIFSDGAWTDH